MLPLIGRLLAIALAASLICRGLSWALHSFYQRQKDEALPQTYSMLGNFTAMFAVITVAQLFTTAEQTPPIAVGLAVALGGLWGWSSMRNLFAPAGTATKEDESRSPKSGQPNQKKKKRR